MKLDHCLCGASFLIVSTDCTNLYSRRLLGKEFRVTHSIYCGALLGLGGGGAGIMGERDAVLSQLETRIKINDKDPLALPDLTSSFLQTINK